MPRGLVWWLPSPSATWQDLASTPAEVESPEESPPRAKVAYLIIDHRVGGSDLNHHVTKRTTGITSRLGDPRDHDHIGKTYALGATRRADILSLAPFGFVAIGERNEAGKRHFIVAVSKDGSSWHDAAVVGDDMVATSPRLVPTPHGLLVFAGSPADAARSALWRGSTDGLTWTREETAGSLGGANVDEGTSCTSGVTVIGVSSTGAPATWTSTDGLTWLTGSATPEFGLVRLHYSPGRPGRRADVTRIRARSLDRADRAREVAAGISCRGRPEAVSP